VRGAPRCGLGTKKDIAAREKKIKRALDEGRANISFLNRATCERPSALTGQDDKKILFKKKERS